MSAPPLLSVQGVTLQYKTRDHLVTATYRVSFDVLKADRFVLLGPSGCGKSTLLKALIGLVPLADGRAWLLGEELAAADDAARRALLRRIGVMWQSGALFGSMTLAENVELPIEEHTDLPRPAREAGSPTPSPFLWAPNAKRSTPTSMGGSPPNCRPPQCSASPG